MIEPAHGLNRSALEAIAGLERRVVAADGGRLKLEWATLRSRPADRVQDLLWWDGRSCHARRGIGRALLDAALRLMAPPDAPAAEPTLGLRQAAAEDIPALSDLYQDGFGHGHVDADWLVNGRSRTLTIERDGGTVGTVAVARDGRRAAIYGFVVDARRRGNGIGREALRRVCREQFDTGADHVDLEVENDSALGLYTSVGFELEATDDYHELLLG